MVIVRSALNQHWRGNRYEPGDEMPATEVQAERLTRSKQAYYDFKETIEPQALKIDFSDLPASEILEKHFDTINAVSFASDEELLALNGIGEKTLQDIRGFFQ